LSTRYDKLQFVGPEIRLSFAQLFSKFPMLIENRLRNPKELKALEAIV
jgi:hypothetical protein